MGSFSEFHNSRNSFKSFHETRKKKQETKGKVNNLLDTVKKPLKIVFDNVAEKRKIETAQNTVRKIKSQLGTVLSEKQDIISSSNLRQETKDILTKQKEESQTTQNNLRKNISSNLSTPVSKIIGSNNLKYIDSSDLVKASNDIYSKDPIARMSANLRYGLDRGKEGIKNVPKNFFNWLVASTAADNEKYAGEGSIGQKLSKAMYGENAAQESLKTANGTSTNFKDYLKRRNAGNNAESIYQATLPQKTQTAGQVGETVGAMIPTIAASAVNPLLGDAIMFGTTSGAEATNLVDNGVSFQKARTVGNLKGAVEVGTEKIAGGVKFRGKGVLDDIVGNAIARKTTSKVTNFLATKGYQFAGEIGEEYISNVAGYGIDKIFLGEDTSLKNIWEDTKETTKVTFLSTLALNLMGLGGGNTSNTTVVNQIESMSNTKLTEEQKGLINNKLEEIKAEVQDNQKADKVNEIDSTQNVKETTNLQAVENKQDSEYYKSAVKSKIDINNTTVNKIYNLTENRGIKASYNADLFTNNNHNAIWRVNKDSEGNITREVILNPNSATDEKTVQNIIVHELTHDMEGQKVDYEQLSKFALSKMKTQEGYESAFENLKDIYSTVYDRNSDNFNTLVEQEAVADFLGENLGNQEFVNELVASQNRNFVQKIYNWVSNKVQSFGNKITGNTEAEYWRKVKYTFEKALNSEYQENNTQSKFSINSNFKTDYDNWNKVDRSGNFLIGRTSQALQSIGLNDYDIVMDKSKILRIKNDHPEMNDDIIKSIPDILENPTLILDTQSKEKKAKGRKVVFGEVTDTTGNPVLVALELNPVENKTNIDKIYKVASAYGKENLNTIQNWLNSKENILYIDEQKNRTTNWLNGLGLQLPVPYNTSSSISSIAPLNEDVNTTKYSMQEFENNAQKIKENLDIKYSQNTKGAWNKFLKENSVNKGIGETIQDIKLASEKNTKESDVDFSKLTSTQILDKRSKTVTGADIKKALKQAKDVFEQKVVNKYHYIDKLAESSKNNELKYKADRTLSAGMEGQYAIGLAQTNNEGQRIGDSLYDIFEPLNKSKGNNVSKNESKDLYKAFSEYVYLKANEDREMVGKPIFGEDITSSESKKLAEKYEQKYPQFKELQQKVLKYADNELTNLVDAGLITQGEADYLREKYPNYVPVERVKDSSKKVNDTIASGTGIKKAVGGNADIMPINEALAKRTMKIKSVIRFNELLKETAKTLKNVEIQQNYEIKQNYETEYAPELLLSDETSFIKEDNGKYIATYFENGIANEFEVSKDLYQSLKPSSNSNTNNKVLEGWQNIVKVRKNLLTSWSPTFPIKNALKDIQDAPLNSKYPKNFAGNYLKAVNDMRTDGDLWNLYLSNGGGSNTYFDNNSGLKSNKKANKIAVVNELIEQAPRLAEFISTIEDGKSIDEAMYNAAEITTNFKRGGEIAKVADKYGVTFLNASIQGFDKIYRNIKGENGFKGYANLLIKSTIMGIAPSIINHLILDDDEDYQDLTDSEKDLYYLFPKGDGTFIRIPKGRVVSVLGAVARRTVEAAQGEENAFEGMLSTAVNQIAPNNPVEDNILSPISQVLKNKTWYGSDLVNSRLQNELPKNQYDESTDEFSKWLGKKLNVSPVKINYIIDQYSGGAGDVLLPYITSKAHNNNVFTDMFTVDSVLKNKNVSDFYKAVEKQTQISNDIESTENDALSLRYLNSVKAEISDLYKQKRETQMSDLSNNEKMQKVRSIQEKINNKCKEALSNYKTVETTSYTSKVGDKQYYYNESNNEWQALSNNQKELVGSLESVNINCDTYFKYKNETDSIKEKYDNANDRKNALIKKVDSYNLNIAQKAILVKLNYSSYKKYDDEIKKYLKKQNLTSKEYSDILDELGM